MIWSKPYRSWSAVRALFRPRSRVSARHSSAATFMHWRIEFNRSSSSNGFVKKFTAAAFSDTSPRSFGGAPANYGPARSTDVVQRRDTDPADVTPTEVIELRW